MYGLSLTLAPGQESRVSESEPAERTFIRNDFVTRLLASSDRFTRVGVSVVFQPEIIISRKTPADLNSSPAILIAAAAIELKPNETNLAVIELTCTRVVRSG